jgi:hypothetical protein
VSEELRPRDLEPGQHTVTVEVALGCHHPERLGELLAAMTAQLEHVGPPVGAQLAQRVIGVTVTVKATTERAAREFATRELLEEMEGLGLV